MTLSYEESQRRQRIASQKGMQRLYRERKGEAIDQYGGKCATCGSLDRTNLMVVPRKGYHWGWKANGKPFRGGHERMRWLDQNNFPDSHTVVCGPQFSPCRRALQLLE